MEQREIKEGILGDTYLLFGRARDCHNWAEDNLQHIPLVSAKIVKHTRDFLGYRNIKLVYCGPFEPNDDKLYQEALKYFNS